MAEDLLPLLGRNAGGGDSSDSDDERSDDLELDDKQIDEESEDIIIRNQQNMGQIQMTFDKSLPSAHSYLGNDLEEVRGRTIHEDDALITLPIIALPSVVLVPGQIIPLHLFQSQTVAMIKNIVDKDKTFGVVAMSYSSEDNTPTMANIGTTAEIYSIKDEADDRSGISTIRVKARGRQRFKVIEFQRQTTGILLGKVQILPEKSLSNCLAGARPRSHCKFCCFCLDQDSVKTAVDRNGQVLTQVKLTKKRQVDRFTCAHFTQWPQWVFKMYEPEMLMLRIQEELQSWNDSLRPENMPKEATDFSYWVAQNLPLDDNMRIHLLSIDNAIRRLRCELNIMQKCTILCCRDCGCQIANKKDVFSMSLEGPLGAYVNPGGYVHETLTLYKTRSLNLIGRASTENSWFPGYAWTIVQCYQCSAHMGWCFTAVKRKLSPQKFWGLCRASLIPGILNAEDEEDWASISDL